tara:strand:+ start:2683 stop:2820 length:138 start_codon:yes stop_codon:yes gene_type:complete
MTLAVYRGALALGVAAPQHEYNAAALAVDQLHHPVSELLPSLALV